MWVSQVICPSSFNQGLSCSPRLQHPPSSTHTQPSPCLCSQQHGPRAEEPPPVGILLLLLQPQTCWKRLWNTLVPGRFLPSAHPPLSPVFPWHLLHNVVDGDVQQPPIQCPHIQGASSQGLPGMERHQELLLQPQSPKVQLCPLTEPFTFARGMVAT